MIRRRETASSDRAHATRETEAALRLSGHSRATGHDGAAIDADDRAQTSPCPLLPNESLGQHHRDIAIAARDKTFREPQGPMFTIKPACIWPPTNTCPVTVS
jgi:hypothetical protein